MRGPANYAELRRLAHECRMAGALIHVGVGGPALRRAARHINEYIAGSLTSIRAIAELREEAEYARRHGEGHVAAKINEAADAVANAELGHVT